MKTVKPDPRIINSLQRAIDILGLFSHKNRTLSLTEIAHRMQLPKSTIAGLVYTMLKNGYLDQDSETRRYRLGLALLERGDVVQKSIEIDQIAFPHLHNLQAKYDESIFLAIIRGFEIVIVNRLWGSSSLNVYTPIGDKIELLHTATGTSVLASLPPEEVEVFLDQYYEMCPEKYDPEKHNNLLQEIDRSRVDGFAINYKGKEPGVCYIGSAIKDFQGKPVAVIVISIPIARVRDDELPMIGRMLNETALKISTEIGYQATERIHNVYG